MWAEHSAVAQASSYQSQPHEKPLTCFTEIQKVFYPCSPRLIRFSKTLDMVIDKLGKYDAPHRLPTREIVDLKILESLQDYFSAVCSKLRMDGRRQEVIATNRKFDLVIAGELLQMLPVDPYHAGEYLTNLYNEIEEAIRSSTDFTGRWGSLEKRGNSIILTANDLEFPELDALPPCEILA